MVGTMRGYLDAAQPGPWREALEEVEQASVRHATLWARTKGDYATFYDTPEHARGILDPALAESVAAIESSSAAVAAARDSLPAARDAAFASEAGRLGGAPRIDGEPDWVRLMRDLESLRAWRVAHLDAIDVHLPPLLARKVAKGEPTPMAEQAFKAWSKAFGVSLQAVRQRCLDLALAGLLPGVEAMPGDHAHIHADPGPRAAALGALVLRDGAETLAAEVAQAAAALPPERFPVPEAVLDQLGHALGPTFR